MTSLSRESAIALARQRIEHLALAAGDLFEILIDFTEEVERGWVFFYNTQDFVRTRDPISALAGNGPIFVTREGAVHDLPSAVPWEEAVAKIS